MRVLLSALVPSHLMPIVPLAWALRSRGHDVLVTGDAPVTAAAHQAGLATSALAVREVAPATGRGPEEERNPGTVRTEAYLPGYLDVARAWGAELVVTDPLEHAGWIVAAALGVPLVVHRYGPEDFSTALHHAMREPLRPYAEAAGAAPGLPDPDLLLDPCPPGLQSDALAPARAVRFVPYNGPGGVPGELLRAPAGRRVCVCLGVRGSEQLRTESRLPAGFAHVLAAIEAADGLEGVLALPAGDPQPALALPPSVRPVHGMPIAPAVRRSDLVVHHGGAGTALTALASGVPQLVLPQGEPFLAANAERVAATGAGRALLSEEEQHDAALVARAVADVLDTPEYGTSAQLLRSGIEALPTPAELVGALEELVARRTPAR